jgi:hypothetical protein
MLNTTSRINILTGFRESIGRANRYDLTKVSIYSENFVVLKGLDVQKVITQPFSS